MKINQALNLVVSTESEDGSPVYIHSTPLSKDIFREHFLILGRLYGEFFSTGLGMLSSARTAYLLLQKIAKESDAWEGKDGVQNTLITHIINGANAIYLEEGRGWKSIPLEEAIQRGIVDLYEVMDELVFFTCVCAMAKKNQAHEIVMATVSMWGSLGTSLSCMEYMNFLKTSPKEEATAPKAGSREDSHSQTGPAPLLEESGRTVSSIPS